MSFMREVRNPWWLLAGVTAGGVAWALSIPVLLAVFVGLVVYGTTVSVAALTKSSAPEPVLTRLSTSPSVQPFVDRAHEALEELQELSAHAGPVLAVNLSQVAVSALETFTSLETLSSQVVSVESALSRVDTVSVRAQRADVEHQLKGADAGLRRDLEASLASLRDQEAVGERLRLAHQRAVARMQSTAITLEGLVASAAEVVTLSGSSLGEGAARSKLSDLDAQLQGLRTGLNEMEQLSRNTLTEF